MKASEYIALCAKSMEEGAAGTDYSCVVLAYFSGAELSRDKKEALREEYAGLFRPKLDNDAAAWLRGAQQAGLIDASEMKDWRVTALCFFAAMLEAEGR